MDSFRYILYVYKRTILRASGREKDKKIRCGSIRRREISRPAKPVGRRRMFLLWTKCRSIAIVWESSPRRRAEVLGIAIKSVALSCGTARSPTDTPTMPEPARHTTTCRRTSRSIFGEGQPKRFSAICRLTHTDSYRGSLWLQIHQCYH